MINNPPFVKKVPLFCTTCGAPMVEEPRIARYDAQTGEPELVIVFVCANGGSEHGESRIIGEPINDLKNEIEKIKKFFKNWKLGGKR